MPEETLNTEVQTSNEEVTTSTETSTPASTSTTCGSCETQTCKGNNTLGLVALIIAIIGLLATISLIGSIVGIPLLILALILGIIALFRRPRGNAVASVIISLLPLGFLLYLAAMFGNIIIQPTFEFVRGIQADYAQNPLMQEVIEQPGFDRFLQNRLESRFKSINRQDITLTTKGSPKQQMQYYIAFTLNEVRAEIPETINAWIAQYGLPENLQDFSGPETVWPLTDTSRILRDFDGQAVSGYYTLSFTTTSLSAKLCNTINGEFSTTDNLLNAPLLTSTQMLCIDEEANVLEAAFQPDGATFSIASTRMVGENAERLAITTSEGHIFLYAKQSQLIGGEQDEHGCYLTAGYSWNEEAQECQRPWENENPSEATFCTMDAKICPDGSFVGRSGPNCEFSPCPEGTASDDKAIEEVQKILDSLDE